MSRPNVLMVFPRFNRNSFWSLEAACEVSGVKCPAPPLGLITLAAMLPKEWSIRLVDRNAQELTDQDLAWADMVMTGGMLPQRLDCIQVIERAQKAGKIVVIGGPDPMSSPDIYAMADFRVLGEAESIIGDFIAAWERGERGGTFEAVKFQADVTKSPTPRFDLLNFKNYLYIGVQFSRGCPFTCEFCDIIELYGRVPRSKTNAQMLTELQALYDAGYRGHVDFVDDNLIGNKKALKRFLPELEAWQRERGYPFLFSTEASINLSDDPELLQMLSQCNFFACFVGIESPDPETLVSASKKQNTRRSLADSVHRIYDGGIAVIAGFIVGFDTEKASMADAMIDCIEATSIPVCMLGLLTALPNTQLTRRLEAEGRLLPLIMDKGDQCTGGLNFKTLRPRSEILRDYHKVLSSIYTPEAFFERLTHVGLALKRPNLKVKLIPHVVMEDLRRASRLAWRFSFKLPGTRKPFWKMIRTLARQNPLSLETVLIMAGLYLHHNPFSRYVIGELEAMIREAEERERAGLSIDLAPPRPIAAE